MTEKWIPKDLKKGQLHRDLGVSQDQEIPESKLQEAAEEGGKVGQRARFAETAKGFRHGKHVGTPVQKEKV